MSTSSFTTSSLPPKDESSRPSILLPFYFEDFWLQLFEAMGFRTVWAPTAEKLEQVLTHNPPPDVAIEWQRGRSDFPIRDMLRRAGLKTPVFLLLNWNLCKPPDFPTLGYHDVIEFPLEYENMVNKFQTVIPDLPG